MMEVGMIRGVASAARGWALPSPVPPPTRADPALDREKLAFEGGGALGRTIPCALPQPPTSWGAGAFRPLPDGVQGKAEPSPGAALTAF